MPDFHKIKDNPAPLEKHSTMAETLALSSHLSLMADSSTALFWGVGGVLLGPNMQHMEVPRPGVELELQLLAYTTATPGLSLIFDLHHSS